MINAQESLQMIFDLLPNKIDRDLSGSFVKYELNELNNEEFRLIVQFESPHMMSIGYESHDKNYYPIEYHFPDGQCYGALWHVDDISSEKIIAGFSQTFGWVEIFI